MTRTFLPTAALASLLLAGSASSATLTITPDKSTYLVGETITLSVLGDAEGATGGFVSGTLLFDPDLANWLSSNQVPLTSFDGAVTWTQGILSGGAGFATVFNQLVSQSPVWPVDEPLMATVTLQTASPGTLAFSWDADSLSFFGLTTAPGGSVTIVPEPATGLLLALGLLGLGGRRAARRRR